MASARDYAQWIVQNQDKQGTPEFDTVAKAYQVAKQQSAPQQQYDPTEGMSTFDKVAAGAGKSVVDTWRNIKQLASDVGIGDRAAIQKEIDDSKALDRPLMNTGAGIAGNALGTIAQFVGPGMMLKGAGELANLPKLASAGRAMIAPQSIPGAAAQGAAMGAMEPVSSIDSRGKNMAVGAVGGAALPLALGVGGLGKSLVQPFTQGGREKIAGQTIERFAQDPNAVLSASPQGLVPGSLPTLAEAVDDPGISQLQRVLQNNPDSANAITQRLRDNNSARVTALQDIAGDQGKHDLYTGMREQMTKPLYDTAFAQGMNETPWIKGQITQLQQRPAFQKAWTDAVELAANQGIKIDPENATQVAHFAKMALDDQLSTAVRAGNKNQARALQDIQGKLVSLMESKDFSPAYGVARETYRDMSKPINQMDVGQRLLDTLQPALAQFGANNRVNAASYAKAVRDADATARKATGFSGAKLENIMDPQQLSTINNVASELGNAARAQELGSARGSPTAQNLISQDVLRQVAGPLGVPTSWAEAALPQTLMRPLQAAYKIPEQRVLGLLGQAALDPDLAKQLIEASRRRSAMGVMAGQAIPYTSSVGAAGLLGLAP